MLTRLGVRVRIIDQSTGAAPYSRALGVHARTLEFYRQLGISGAAIDLGVVVRALNFWVAHSRVARVPLERFGEGSTPFPFLLDLAQDAHERLLIAHLETLGVTVERETRLVHFDPQDDGVRATLERRDGSEDVCESSYLAGCDGAHSTVREVLDIAFPGGTYSKLFYVADVTAAGPVANGEIHVDLDADDLLAVFTMKGEGHVRLVGTIREGAVDTGREQTFEDVSHRVIDRLHLTISRVNWFSTYRVHHRVAERFRIGRAFLLGDAAHIHSPVGAQGMNTGIGDAVNLAWKLAAVMRGTATVALLDSYEPERIAFARRLVATTDRAFVLITRPGRLAAFLRTRVLPIVAPMLLRLPLARRLLFRTVSQIGINYRGSRLSAGSAGSVRGGDRLPWIPLAHLDDDGADNFTPLESMSWQVHVYGEPRQELREACAERGLSIATFAWRTAMGDAGLARDALYLVRPDGYVALADASANPRTLREFLTTRGM